MTTKLATIFVEKGALTGNIAIFRGFFGMFHQNFDFSLKTSLKNF